MGDKPLPAQLDIGKLTQCNIDWVCELNVIKPLAFKCKTVCPGVKELTEISVEQDVDDTTQGNCRSILLNESMSALEKALLNIALPVFSV